MLLQKRLRSYAAITKWKAPNSAMRELATSVVVFRVSSLARQSAGALAVNHVLCYLLSVKPMTHAPETGAINRLHFLAPVFRTVCVWITGLYPAINVSGKSMKLSGGTICHGLGL